ncbi:transmembrane protein 116 isoform X2 [Salmo salar]|uniref:Si:dkey-30c15.2 n=3 Tax=Salmo TaxID=8028 RepID=A0A674CID5_SALTR|nr:transmembrane protein 116-like isoform X2 [Salmo salar]XP_029613447.1 transmembrane protein 116-like isoform X1 [Salmo trutta]XP_029613448.1 transmembrane protein 116-like isoform X1 [Salmo trutta]|eukprot:XP_013980329.1 PREDICTED: transmembrane protein 116-like isoform X1 [Salmo salar]
MSLNRFLSSDQITGLSTVYLVSLSISLIGSFSVLVVSIVKRSHLQEQVNPLVQLALADLLAAVTLMFTSAMNETHTFTPSVFICEKLLPLSLMFYFVSFLLMVVYAWESKHAVEGWRERPREEESRCRQRVGVVPVYACVWFIPLVMYFVYVMTLVLVPPSHMTANNSEASTYCNSCILFLHIWRDNCSDIEHIHDIFIQCFLFVSVIPVLVCCTVVYYKVGSWYRRYEEEGLFPVEGDARSRKRLRGMFSTARYMMVVIIFCWTPALVLVVLSVIPDIPQVNLFPLYIIQAVTLSLQGCLNSVVYAWRRPNFRDAVLGERMPLLSQDAPLPFFDESLRGPLGPLTSNS